MFLWLEVMTSRCVGEIRCFDLMLECCAADDLLVVSTVTSYIHHRQQVLHSLWSWPDPDCCPFLGNCSCGVSATLCCRKNGITKDVLCTIACAADRILGPVRQASLAYDAILADIRVWRPQSLLFPTTANNEPFTHDSRLHVSHYCATSKLQYWKVLSNSTDTCRRVPPPALEMQALNALAWQDFRR